MKKQELLNILNESADSINLHDGSLITMRRDGDSLTFYIWIGEYHYIINDLEPYVDNLKDLLVLSLTFTGVNNLKERYVEDFQLFNCDIIDNENIDGTFEFILFDCDYEGVISFSFKDFFWDVIKELSYAEYEEWRDDFVKKL